MNNFQSGKTQSRRDQAPINQAGAKPTAPTLDPQGVLREMHERRIASMTTQNNAMAKSAEPQMRINYYDDQGRAMKTGNMQHGAAYTFKGADGKRIDPRGGGANYR